MSIAHSHVAEPLAGWPTANEIDFPTTGKSTVNVAEFEIGDGLTKGLSIREIPLVRRNVVSISFDPQQHVEPGLLEPEGHPAGTAKQVDGYRSLGHSVTFLNSFFPVGHCGSSGQIPHFGLRGVQTSRPWTIKPMCSSLLRPSGAILARAFCAFV